MTISSVGSTNSLVKQLEASGLSASKANLVQSDLAASRKVAPASNATKTISPSVRAAFETKIAADVLSGKLSASDAAAVKKTMNNLGADTTDAATTQPAGAVAGAAPAAGAGGAKPAGGGGNPTKTELSEVVTVSGSTMTTVITYTDGTTSSTTATATAADEAKYGKASLSPGAATNRYSPLIDKGAMVDELG